MTDRDRQFLIVYDRRAGTADVRDLGHDVGAAMETYSRREHELANQPDFEVVLVGSASLDSLRRTHSSYFGAAGGLATMLSSR